MRHIGIQSSSVAADSSARSATSGLLSLRVRVKASDPAEKVSGWWVTHDMIESESKKDRDGGMCTILCKLIFLKTIISRYMHCAASLAASRVA